MCIFFLYNEKLIKIEFFLKKKTKNNTLTTTMVEKDQQTLIKVIKIMKI